jgi:hypothetical protein
MLGLYFGGKSFLTKFGNIYGNIELDAAIEETHEWAAEATSNPVEFGTPVTDHVIPKSDKLKIRGLITDTPLVASQAISGVVNLGTVVNRTQALFDMMYKLIKLRETMTVYTQHKIYADMVLINLTIPRAAGIGEAIEFTAEFINIRKVETQMADIPKGINPKKSGKKTDPKKNGGKKEAKKVDKPSSALSRILK